MKLKDQNATLITMHPAYQGSFTLPGEKWDNVAGYTRETGVAGVHIFNGFYHETAIDMVGYSMDYMTFATFDTMFQDPGIYNAKDAAGTAASTLTSLQTLNLVTTAPLSGTDISKIVNNAARRVPGMIGTDQNFKQVVYGRYALYVPNNTLGLTGYLQMIQTQGFGSKEPTAADKLYIYRIIIGVGASNTDTLQVPACRLGLSGRFYHEDDAAYVMRLRRNYLLQKGD